MLLPLSFSVFFGFGVASLALLNALSFGLLWALLFLYFILYLTVGETLYITNGSSHFLVLITHKTNT